MMEEQHGVGDEARIGIEAVASDHTFRIDAASAAGASAMPAPAMDDAPAVELPSQRSTRVGGIVGDFSTIRVSYAPQNLLVAALDEARNAALAIRERRATTGQRIPMPVLRTIASMGVGKTWAAEKLVALCAPTDDEAGRSVLLVELDTSGKQTSLPRGILRELGKRGWNHGSDPETLWDRAIDAMREADVQIVIFDEMNNAARRPSIGPVIGGDVMRLLLKGDAAVAFLGTPEADKVFERCPALKDRMKAPVVMRPLEWLLDDKRIFLNFLHDMDEALADRRLTDGVSEIADEAIAKPLWDVCRGRLRPLCLLLEEAVAALHREGAEPKILSAQVLAQAVHDHSVPAGIVAYNPFTEEAPE
jgi:hypothetical protein